MQWNMSEKGKIKQSILPVYLVYILCLNCQSSFTATFYELICFRLVSYRSRTLHVVL